MYGDGELGADTSGRIKGVCWSGVGNGVLFRLDSLTGLGDFATARGEAVVATRTGAGGGFGTGTKTLNAPKIAQIATEPKTIAPINLSKTTGPPVGFS